MTRSAPQRNRGSRRKAGDALMLTKRELPSLVSVLLARFDVIAPTYSAEGHSIVLDGISSPDQVATGYDDRQGPGRYTVQRSGGGPLFGYSNGPHSPKKFLHPGRYTLYEGEWKADGFVLAAPALAPSLSQGEKGSALTPTLSQGERAEETGERGEDAGDGWRPYAFFGIRPCDSFAIQVLDKTFLHVANADVHYARRRDRSFVAVINCTDPGEVCFCASVGTGPRAESGYDLRLTEMGDGFLLEPGTDEGTDILAPLPTRKATLFELAEADRLIQEAIPRMGRKLDTHNLPQILRSELDHPYWDTMKDWCVGCTNCTIVCPTCFCNDTTDHIDLSTGKVRRDRVWDSCFTWQFAEMHGANPRGELKHRYRHWCVHKLGYWVEQYGVFGCVGCGRCLTWCPVAIDITAVATTIRGGK